MYREIISMFTGACYNKSVAATKIHPDMFYSYIIKS